jgi:YHS domain-containing protein
MLAEGPNAWTLRAAYPRPRTDDDGGRTNPMAIAIDPVCGMEVDTETSDLTLEHEGKTYWFCGRGCLLEFRDDPGRYLDPDYVPSM